MGDNININPKKIIPKPKVVVPKPKRTIEENLQYLYSKYGDENKDNKKLVKKKMDK